MNNTEGEPITVEQVFWKESELKDFARSVFDLFNAGFGPKEDGHRNYLRNQFESGLLRQSSNSDNPVLVKFQKKGLTFAFVHSVSRIYRNEQEELINFYGQEIKPPLEDMFYFSVGVQRFLGDRLVFKQVCDFFQELREKDFPIEAIFPEDFLKERDFYGRVLAWVNGERFNAGLGNAEVQVHTPRVRAKRMMETEKEDNLI